MKYIRHLSFAAATIAALSVTGLADDASACAVLTPDQSVPVTGHQMILSLSMERTTLWDRFVYTGDPASFAWILPTKGTVEIGLSSDAIFDALGQATAPQVFAPSGVCPNTCLGQGGNDGGGGVSVISEQAIGPYQTVQLSSSDPAALKDWLQMNGYPVPAQVLPVLDAYVAEGFDFVAMKLLPEVGVDAIQPVRISMTGAAPSVPIRLLAAGTGEITQVTLWVASDGKYLPGNAPIVKMSADELVWDFAADSSNYEAVRTEKLAATNGLGYLIEGARPYETWEIEEPLAQLVQDDPAGSGYGADAASAQMGLDADMDALFGTLGMSPWITRLSADLSRDALAKDLMLTAPADQSAVDNVYTPKSHINESACPPDPCAEGGSGGTGTGGTGTGASGNGGNGGSSGSGNGGDGDDGSEGGCAMPGSSPVESGAAGVLAALGLLIAARRRRASR